MIRFAFGAVVLLALGVTAAWLAGHSGILALEVADLRIETTVVTATVATALLILVSVALHHLWRWLRRSPGSFGASRAARQRRRLDRGPRRLRPPPSRPASDSPARPRSTTRGSSGSR